MWWKKHAQPRFLNVEKYQTLFHKIHTWQHWTVFRTSPLFHQVDKIVFHFDLSKALVFTKKNKMYPVTIHDSVLCTLLDTLHEKNIPFLILPKPTTRRFFDHLVNASSFFFSLLTYVLMGSTFFLKIPNTNPDVFKVYHPVKNNSIDWIGNPEILNESLQMVSLLRSHSPLSPRGILLEGMPGTGKTLLAKKIACEMNVSFIPVVASQFIEVYAGVGPQRVRQLFRLAEQHTPCIIFIDEIDSIGMQRKDGGGGFQEQETTLNQILSEMDGFESSKQILVIAATNRPEILDKALLRSGRFDKKIHIPLPDDASRQKMFKLYLPEQKNTTIEYDALSSMTEGLTGADIRSIVQDAVYTAHHKHETINMVHLDTALEKFHIGLIKQQDDRTPEELRRVAIHEFGHAIMAHHFSDTFHLYKVSIQANHNGIGGFTLYHALSSVNQNDRAFFEKKMILLLGGKAAEESYYGRNRTSTGAHSDLLTANNLAHALITRFGFFSRSPVVCPIPPFSESMNVDIEQDVQQMLDNAYRSALDILSFYKDSMEPRVDYLIRHKSINGQQFAKI